MQSLLPLCLVLVVIFLPDLSKFRHSIKAKYTESVPQKAKGLGLVLNSRNVETRGIDIRKSAVMLQTKPKSRKSQKNNYGKNVKKSTQLFVNDRLRFKRQTTKKLGFQTLKIAAFNVQTFGVKKMTSDPIIRNTLVKIVMRYDVILIQEIRDITGTAINNLLMLVNRAAGPDQVYGITISPRLGRSVSKEQYAYIYNALWYKHLVTNGVTGTQARWVIHQLCGIIVCFFAKAFAHYIRTSLLIPTKSYVYDDGDESKQNDTFEREPYIVHFNATTAAIQDFVLVGIHTSPSKAAQEVDQLANVYDDVVQRWHINDVIIMGDFNVACNYVKDSDWKKMRLATDKRFDWLISNCLDTTVAGGTCAYDRFVVAGPKLKEAIVPQSAGRFNFDDFYGLNQTQTEAISDHYPIEMQLYSKEWRSASNLVAESEEYTFKSSQAPKLSIFDVRKLRFRHTNPLLKDHGYHTTNLYSSSGRSLIIIVEKAVTSVSRALTELAAIQGYWHSLVTANQISMATAKLKQVMSSGGTSPVTVRLVCGVVTSSWRCWIALTLG